MIETSNLILRESTFDDCALFAEWESREEIQNFFTMNEDHDYEEIVTYYFQALTDPTRELFTILLKPENRVIGRIILSRIDREEDSLDLTRIYIGEEENQGKGYGEEAIHAILEYAFINLHMERVTIDHLPHNRRAKYLYHKIGFQDEGIMRHAGKKNGKYFDLHLLSMLRTEYYQMVRQ